MGGPFPHWFLCDGDFPSLWPEPLVSPHKSHLSRDPAGQRPARRDNRHIGRDLSAPATPATAPNLQLVRGTTGERGTTSVRLDESFEPVFTTDKRPNGAGHRATYTWSPGRLLLHSSPAGSTTARGWMDRNRPDTPCPRPWPQGREVPVAPGV